MRWIALACLACAALAFFAFRHRDGQSLPGGPRPGAAEESKAVELETEAPSTAEPRAEPELAGVLRFEPLEPQPSSLRVRLLRGDSEEAVAGAEAWLLECDDYEWSARVTDVEAEVRARGRRVEVDAEGWVRFDLPLPFDFLCARAGDLFGAEMFLTRDAPEDELRLYPAHACRVRTCSESGAPLAGVPIAVGRGSEVWWRDTTGPGGEIAVPNLEWIVADNNGTEKEWFVGVEEPGSVALLRRFEGLAAPREVEFRLPEASALQLRVVAADGAAVPVRGTVVLGLLHGRGSSTVAFGDDRRPEFLIRGGEARVPRAEPGAWLEAEVQLEGGFSFSQSLRVPERGSEPLELELPPDALALTFRAVDGLGAPIAGRELVWQQRAEERASGGLLHLTSDAATTDDLGRAALVIDRSNIVGPGPEPDEPPPPARRCSGWLRLAERREALASAAIPLDALATLAHFDLGVLRLEHATPLARGRVLDANGAPLIGASVKLEHSGPDEASGVGEIAGVGYRFVEADGSFAFFGSVPDGRMRLIAECDGYALAPGERFSEFDARASPEVEIRLVRTGVLVSSVLADARLDRDYTWILTGEDGEWRTSIYATQSPGLIESECWWLRPGTYRVELVTGYPLDPPIVAIDDVLVRAGEKTVDPRLQRVPLHIAHPGQAVASGPLERMRVEVVDVEGRAIERGLVVGWEGCGWGRQDFAGGSFEVGRVGASRWLGVWAPGQRYWEGACSDANLRVVLQPALRLRVHADVPAEVRRAGVCLLVDPLRREQDDPARWLPDLRGSIELDANGDARFECPATCRMRVGLRARRIDAAGAVHGEDVELETPDELWVEVADQPGEQLRTLAIPAAAWDELLRSLRAAR